VVTWYLSASIVDLIDVIFRVTVDSNIPRLLQKLEQVFPCTATRHPAVNVIAVVIIMSNIFSLINSNHLCFMYSKKEELKWLHSLGEFLSYVLLSCKEYFVLYTGVIFIDSFPNWFQLYIVSTLSSTAQSTSYTHVLRTVAHRIVLYHIVLYCSTLYCTVSHCIVL